MNTNKNQGRGLAKVSHLFLSGPKPSREKVTIPMAAKVLNVSKGTVVTYLNTGLLSRIKERGCIYIAEDEVKGLLDHGSRKRPTTRRSNESESRATDAEQNTTCTQPHTELQRLEGAGRDMSETEWGKNHRDMEFLEAEIVSLQRNLAAQAIQLEGIKSGLEKLRKKQERELADFNKAANTEVQEREKTQARLLAVEEELQRLRRSWWKKVFSG
jgi:hypothetical protein